MDINVCAPSVFPVEVVYCLLYCESGQTIEPIPALPVKNGWGNIQSSTVIRIVENSSMPYRVSLCYLSIVENKFYEADYDFTQYAVDAYKQMYENFSEIGILVGMGPGGVCTLWIYNGLQSKFVTTINAKISNVTLGDYKPFYQGEKVEHLCNTYIMEDSAIQKYLTIYGLPNKQKFLNRMQQYLYRYIVTFGKFNGQTLKGDNDSWNIIALSEKLIDGSFDKTDLVRMTHFHYGGVPSILNFTIGNDKKEYMLNIWLEDNFHVMFERFYGAHPETKTDFIIRIDAENRKYELALYRQGLKEPVVIPESAYQLIVFKNKFEDYRSENYNQPRGAWIW